MYKKIRTDLDKNAFITLLFISFLILYISFRPNLLQFVFGLLGMIFVAKNTNTLKKVGFIKTIKPKKILFVLGFIYLIICALYFRDTSVDGLNLYIKNVFVLKDHSDIFYYEYPYFPYLTELFLGLLFRVFNSLWIVNLAFGLTALLSLVTTFFLYKLLGVIESSSKQALFLLATSPVFIHFAFFQFKVDLFLLLVTNLLLIVFLLFVRKPTTTKALFMGILMGCGFLIKVSFLPILVCVLCFSIFELLLQKTKLMKAASVVFTLCLSIFVILYLWIIQHGLYLFPSFMINRDLSFGPTQYFEVDVVARHACFVEHATNSKSEMFLDTTKLQRFSQPIQYVLGITADFTNYDFTFFNPGPVIYLSIFLFIILPFLSPFITKNRSNIYIYLLVLFNIIFFFVVHRTYYWYLLPLFPTIVLFLPLIVGSKSKSVYSKLLIPLVFSIGVFYLSAGIIGLMNNLMEKSVNVQSGAQKIYARNAFINLTNTNKKVMVASERPWNISVPFVTNADTRIVYSYSYFVSSRKPLDHIYLELREKNIGYIVVHKNYITSDVYKGCMAENNKILDRFISAYTKPIYDLEGDLSVFEIL